MPLLATDEEFHESPLIQTNTTQQNEKLGRFSKVRRSGRMTYHKDLTSFAVMA
jgi:hypothetical protein